MRVAILLDEGLKPVNANSAITKDQTLLCLEILINWLFPGQNEDGRKTEILGYYGLINQAIKLLESNSLQVKQRSLHLLGSLQLTGHLVSEIFASPSLVALLLTLMVDKEYSLAWNAAKFFNNISHFFDSVRLEPENIDLDKVYQSLVSMD